MRVRPSPEAEPFRDGELDWGANKRTSRLLVGDVMVEAAGAIDFVDPSLAPAVERVRALVGRQEFDPGLIPRATMVRANDGAPLSPLRTFTGRLAHENGIVPSRKSGRALGWEGENQYNMIIKAQTMHDVVHVATESVRFEYVDAGVPKKYTSDIELVGTGGRRRLIEMKRDEGDLADPDLCRTLAIVAELCRCCAISFEILFARDVFVSRIHRKQAGEFASRAFSGIDGVHRRALKEHAEDTGRNSTYGALRKALCPTDRRRGTAVVQAMTVARVVELDLVKRLREHTPVVLHPQNMLP